MNTTQPTANALTPAQHDILTQLRMYAGPLELPGRSIRPVKALAAAGLLTYREKWVRYRNGRIVKILTVKDAVRPGA
jgi:hypothetical protein